METGQSPNRSVGLPPETRVGGVSLVTDDVERLRGFYERILGLRSLGEDAAGVHLGPDGGEPFLTLAQRAGARPPMGPTTGLYHLAILLPTRDDLARAFAHLLGVKAPFSGFADHRVSEALYLNDPDGNGIEIYRDRPRAEWVWHGGLVAMTVDPLDAEGLLLDAGSSPAPWPGIPAETILGHVHLRVSDLGRAEAFYQGLLGFDVTARLPGAVFVAAGGYHHHLGLNTWQSRGAASPSEGALGLREVTILLPHPAALAAIQERLQSAGWPVETEGTSLRLRDPSSNGLRLAATPEISPLV